MHEADSDSLSGTVEHIVFHNTQTGFTILKLSPPKNNLIIKASTQPGLNITVQGHFPSVQCGQELHILGAWTMHPKFGRQFSAQSYSIQLPTSTAGLKKYLGSGIIKGIGPSYAEKLVDHFGTQVLDIIEASPSRLQEIPGFGTKRIERIVHAWQDQKHIAHIMVFLQEKSVSPTYAAKIYKKYGMQSIAIVTENPYRLADDIWGISFKIADQIAQRMGFAPDSIKRIKSGILFYLSSVTQTGSLYSEIDQLKQETLSLLNLTDSNAPLKLRSALHELFSTRKIALITHSNMHYVCTAQHYYVEKGVARAIHTLCETPSQHVFDIDAIYNRMRTNSLSHEQIGISTKKQHPIDLNNIDLNDDQQRGILACLQHKITIITGGPGTGKTTLIKTLLTILDEHKQTYKLAAPTGRAAKRMQEGTGRYAQTIHRLLEFDVSSMQFTRNEQNALDAHFLIIDEASMLDIFLAHAILKATSLHTHLVFIGDIHQLPSVGPGNFLHDLRASAIIPCTTLSTIFRQAQNSLIVMNAHNINSGVFPVHSLPNTKKDFIYIKEENPDAITTHLSHIIHKGLPAFGLRPADMIVLAPMNRGNAGTQKINYDMQQLLNSDPEKKYTMHAGILFREGDRVMQTRNNYDKHVYNGDIGIIHTINTIDTIVTVQYPDKIVDYEFSELDELVLAYAISIHKSQGSEYPAVVIPLFMQHFTLLQRNVLYTAVTRAKKVCILIGQPKAIAVSIRTNKGLTRTTFLKEYLTSSLECRHPL